MPRAQDLLEQLDRPLRPPPFPAAHGNARRCGRLLAAPRRPGRRSPEPRRRTRSSSASPRATRSRTASCCGRGWRHRSSSRTAGCRRPRCRSAGAWRPTPTCATSCAAGKWSPYRSSRTRCTSSSTASSRDATTTTGSTTATTSARSGTHARRRPHGERVGSMSVRLRVLPELGQRLLLGVPAHGRGGSRLRRPSRRLHLRVRHRRATAACGDVPVPDQFRSRLHDARPLPAAARALQERPRPPAGAPALPVDDRVGRPRGPERLRGAGAGRRRAESGVHGSARLRLSGVLRAHPAARQPRSRASTT